MGLFDGFPFKSREDSEKEKKAFERRVFPFGLEQRDCARAVLRELMPHIKNDTELLFAFISAKDAYMLAEESGEAMQLARAQMKKLRNFTEEDKDKMMALLLLDVCAPSLEKYPTAQDVLTRVAN